jgi:hypothetical protein
MSGRAFLVLFQQPAFFPENEQQRLSTSSCLLCSDCCHKRTEKLFLNLQNALFLFVEGFHQDDGVVIRLLRRIVIWLCWYAGAV